MLLGYKLVCVTGSWRWRKGDDRDERQTLKLYFCSSKMNSLTTRPQALCINNESTCQEAEVVVLAPTCLTVNVHTPKTRRATQRWGNVTLELYFLPSQSNHIVRTAPEVGQNHLCPPSVCKHTHMQLVDRAGQCVKQTKSYVNQMSGQPRGKYIRPWV